MLVVCYSNINSCGMARTDGDDFLNSLTESEVGPPHSLACSTSYVSDALCSCKIFYNRQEAAIVLMNSTCCTENLIISFLVNLNHDRCKCICYHAQQ